MATKLAFHAKVKPLIIGTIVKDEREYRNKGGHAWISHLIDTCYHLIGDDDIVPQHVMTEFESYDPMLCTYMPMFVAFGITLVQHNPNATIRMYTSKKHAEKFRRTIEDANVDSSRFRVSIKDAVWNRGDAENILFWPALEKTSPYYMEKIMMPILLTKPTQILCLGAFQALHFWPQGPLPPANYKRIGFQS